MKQVDKLVYWTTKVLPTVYDDSLSYMELLNKVVEKLNEVIENSNELQDLIYETVENYIQTNIDKFKVKPKYVLEEERIYFDN